MQKTIEKHNFRQANYSKSIQKKDNIYINKNFLIWVTFPSKTKPMLFAAEPYRLLINDEKLVNMHFKTVKSNKLSKTTILSIRVLKIDLCPNK